MGRGLRLCPRPGHAALSAHPGDLLGAGDNHSALEMSPLRTVSQVHAILRKASLPSSAVEVKADGAAITPAGFLTRDLRVRAGEMTGTGELFEGPDPVASLKCLLSCLLKVPCRFQRLAYCKVN